MRYINLSNFILLAVLGCGFAWFGGIACAQDSNEAVATALPPARGEVIFHDIYANRDTPGWAEDGVWANSLTQRSLKQVADAGQILSLSFRGYSQTTRRIEEASVSSDNVYVLEFRAKAVGQIERMRVRAQKISSPWTTFGALDIASPQNTWQYYRLQCRPQDDVVSPCVRLLLYGVGELLVSEMRLYKTDTFEIPPARENMARPFVLENSLFHFEAARWHTKNDVEFHPDAANAKYYAQLGERGSLWYEEAFRVYYGEVYHIRIRGVSDDDNLALILDRSVLAGKMQRQRWKVDLKDGVFEAVFAPAIPEFGSLSEGDAGLCILSLHAKRAARVDEITVTVNRQVTTTPVESGVMVFSRDPFGSSIVVGEALEGVARVSGVTDEVAGKIQLRDERGELVLEAATSLARMDDGTIGSRFSLAGVPVGWYDVTFTSGDIELHAVPREIAVLPRMPPAGYQDEFFGAHLAYEQDRSIVDGVAHWEWTLSPDRHAQARLFGVRHSRMHPPLFTKWWYVEKTKGQWTMPDEQIDLILDSGISVLGLLDGTAHYASSAPDDILEKTYPWVNSWGTYPARDIDDWERYVRKIVSHFKGRINEWEIWNEPNHSPFMGLNPQLHESRAEEYVRLVMSAYRVAKQVDPQLTIIVGATAGGGAKFEEEIFKLGVLDYCDAYSFHGYGQSSAAHFGAASFSDYTAGTRARMEKYGTVKPIWDSEASVYSIPPGRAGKYLSEVQLKGMITRQVAGISRFFLYFGQTLHTPLDGGYKSLLGFNERPVVFQSLVAAFHRLIGDYRFERDLGNDPDGVHVYSFVGEQGGRVLAGWTSQQDNHATLTQTIMPDGVVLTQTGRTTGAFSAGRLELTNELRYYLVADHPKLRFFDPVAR
jgi:hypothetical protein